MTAELCFESRRFAGPFLYTLSAGLYEDTRFLGGNKYAFQDGDEVLLVPSIAGGTR